MVRVHPTLSSRPGARSRESADELSGNALVAAAVGGMKTKAAPEKTLRGCFRSASCVVQEQLFFVQLIGFDVLLVPPFPVAVSVTV